jgi:YidC/Oxa1 family membrane protein insertase
MIPSIVKQQKSTRINSLIQPEVQAIQKKYKGKDDRQSQMRMQAETQAVYDKYGASMTGGCLTSLVSLIIMLGLYRIILNMPAYIRTFQVYFSNIATQIQTQANYVELLADLASSNGIKGDLTQVNYLIDLMYKFDSSEWAALKELFPAISEVITTNANKIMEVTSFGPINLLESPGLRLSWALLIPLLAGGSQWLTTKLMTPKNANANMEENSMAASLSTMNTVMPLMTVVFCFTFPCYIGIYWVANSVSRLPIQFFVNKHVEKENVDDIIRKNIAKKNKKRAKKGLPPLSEQTVEKNIADLEKKYNVSLKEEPASSKYATSSQRVKTADAGKQVNNTEYYNSRAAKPGSLAAKAGMVRDYNEKNGTKQ